MQSINSLLNKISHNKTLMFFLYFITILFFLIFIFIPTVYLLTALSDIRISGEIVNALLTSVEIGVLTVVIDVLIGVPIAWLLARKKFEGKEILDSLIDMPLIVPTSGLGFSIALFWGSDGLGLLSKGFWLILLLHVSFTISYVIRSVAAAIEETDRSYEIAGRTLGALPLTVFRTITMPLFMGGLLTGMILAFTRSIGETGATTIVVGLEKTAPVLAVGYKNAGDLNSAISLSVILIFISLVPLVGMKLLLKKRFGLAYFYPKIEKVLSRQYASSVWISPLIFMLLILVPSFFFLKYYSFLANTGTIIQSIITSFGIAFGVTVVNLVFALPLAFFINKYRRFGELVDMMLDIVLVMPTVSVGLSLSMFWGRSDVVLIIALAHLSFTYPYVVKPIASALKNFDRNLGEAARSLGATPYQVFASITLPIIMPSIAAGAVLGFMRSLSETGTTIAISPAAFTVPVLIVNLVKQNKFTEAAAAGLILFVVSLIALVVIRKIKGKKW